MPRTPPAEPRVRRLLLPLSLLLGCSGKDGFDISDVRTLRVEPEVLELTTRTDAPAEATFAAWAVLKDGEEVPLDLVSWSSSNLSAGDIDTDGHFTAVDTNGGVTTITAAHVGIEGQATVTVVYTTDVVTDGVDAAVVDAFAEADAEAVETLALAYPPDGVTVPRNLNDLLFAWSDSGGGNTYRIRFRSDITDVSVYVAEREWVAGRELWEIISAANKRGAVSVTVTAGKWDGTTLSDVRRGPESALTVNRLDARGSVLYWSTVSESIMRIPFGTTESEVFWSKADSDGRCTGCHALIETEDGAEDSMIVTHDGVTGRFSVIDVADPADPQVVVRPDDNRRMTFHTASPDNRYIAGTVGSTLTIYELRSGNPLKTIQFDEPITHPDWPPEGDAILLVRVVQELNGHRYNVRSDMDFERSEIVELAWDSDTQQLGDERILKPRSADYAYYYPAYSPDGAWIAYNRSALGSYASRDAQVWLMSRDGDIDLPLTTANQGDNLQNSYPRWGPLPDDEILWLAFSSRRSYPADGFQDLPQIWVAAINPELAAEKLDPSSAAFWLPGQNLSSDNHLPVWWSQ